MDPALLTQPSFWAAREPFSFGKLTAPLPDDPLLQSTVLFETSGSTGKPKWIVLSKAALLASASAVNAHLEVSPSSCWGLALPLHHVGGFGVAARALDAGCRLRTFPQRWDAPVFASWLENNHVTHSSLVPTQVHDLVRHRLRVPACLRAIVVGGGHLDAATGQAARELGWPVLASYGMTEAASQIATQGLDSLTSGYQPFPIPLLPHWQARVTTCGLLEIAGPALFSGYLNLKDDGASVFSAHASPWYLTSDRVRLEGNQLTPLGRADHLVKVLGELVDPEEIERELCALSQGSLVVGTFAILAVPDSRAGQRLVPVFEKKISPEIVAAALDQYALRAPGFRRLQLPCWMDSIPKSPLGKILRADLSMSYGNQNSGNS